MSWLLVPKHVAQEWLKDRRTLSTTLACAAPQVTVGARADETMSVSEVFEPAPDSFSGLCWQVTRKVAQMSMPLSRGGEHLKEG